MWLMCAVTAALAGDLDREAVAQLERRARQSRSDAVVVLHDGEVAFEWHRRSPRLIRSMSVTKSIVGLAIGRLVTLGAIASVDEPMTRWFPEWRGTPKEGITLRHVLEHSSGLKSFRNTREIYRADDFVKLALDAPLEDPPGERFRYNNKAANLLPELVFRVVGQPIDEWLLGDLFSRLGIQEIEWDRDRVGHPHGMAGLAILPRDLARIGQLVLQEGRLGDEQLISEEWIRASTTPSAVYAGHGWLWWLEFEDMAFGVDEGRLKALRDAGVSADFVDKLGPLVGHWPDRQSYMQALRKALGDDWGRQLSEHLMPAEIDIPHVTPGTLRSVSANGSLGQHLVVYPAHDLVGVRMITGRFFHRFRKDAFLDFPELVGALAPAD